MTFHVNRLPAWQTIHMKYQVFFSFFSLSLKINNIKKTRILSAAVVIGASSVNMCRATRKVIKETVNLITVNAP